MQDEIKVAPTLTLRRSAEGMQYECINGNIIMTPLDLVRAVVATLPSRPHVLCMHGRRATTSHIEINNCKIT